MEDKLAPKKKKDPYVLPIAYIKVGKEKRREVKGLLVDVIDLASDKRGLSLIPQPTRALCKNEIHELIATDEVEAGPNKTVDRIAYIGYFEVSQGGLVAVGDPVVVNGKEIGKLAGFDETHLPNHYNIVVFSPKRVSGGEAAFRIGNKLSIGSRSWKETCPQPVDKVT